MGEGYTYPTEQPTHRIDYILRSDDVVARAIAVVTSPLAAAASDHLPVIAQLSLPGRRVGTGH
ncbi:hypothetical protein [Micromonospora sp. WMMD812]|uniref:endonuclease/exonuclease/phosphatase family protein n=1 Tax=Micromonospora sp. WMMD812 TaxID=3015152 RepID=UPI00248B9F40|nr:hypothetical protein [Micromonospora sp. WMMD812]WBB67975.1 hypothetical protein O7603_00925 [Micromonospora sp. WMMD812]